MPVKQLDHPDLVTTTDQFGHTVIKVPYRNFKKVWEPHVDDKEDWKNIALAIVILVMLILLRIAK